jgi:hypothetical protein
MAQRAKGVYKQMTIWHIVLPTILLPQLSYVTRNRLDWPFLEYPHNYKKMLSCTYIQPFNLNFDILVSYKVP